MFSPNPEMRDKIFSLLSSKGTTRNLKPEKSSLLSATMSMMRVQGLSMEDPTRMVRSSRSCAAFALASAPSSAFCMLSPSS